MTGITPDELKIRAETQRAMRYLVESEGLPLDTVLAKMHIEITAVIAMIHGGEIARQCCHLAAEAAAPLAAIKAFAPVMSLAAERPN